jgi:hypothetical protein
VQSYETLYKINENGVYKKTACLVQNGKSYTAAKAYCESYSMKLFVIDSDPVQTQLFTYLETKWANSLMTYRVDGVYDTTDNSWYYYSYGKTPAFAGLRWVFSSDTYDPYNYMTISNLAYPMYKISTTFAVDAYDVSQAINFICEYV